MDYAEEYQTARLQFLGPFRLRLGVLRLAQFGPFRRSMGIALSFSAFPFPRGFAREGEVR